MRVVELVKSILSINSNNSKEDKTYVLYHGNCFDGFTSAWVAHKKLGDEGGEYIPVNYGEDIPEMVDNSTVYILDFSYPIGVLEDLKARMKYVLILDHHKTAMNDLSTFSDAIFDMSRSGCGITWDYFFPDEERPTLVNYMEDRDLWKFSLPNCRFIFDYTSLHKFDFHVWDMIDYSLENNFGECVKDGMVIEAFRSRTINNIIDTNLMWADLMVEGEDNPVRVPFINTTKEFGSEACHTLLEKYNCPIAMYFLIYNGGVTYGIRGDGTYDVGLIAKQFGGGGHPDSAGFELKHVTMPADLITLQETINESYTNS